MAQEPTIPAASPAADGERRLKIITGADDFGRDLKDALVNKLRSLNIEVEDLGVDKYYCAGEEVGRRVSQAAAGNDPTTETRGLVACGTGVGVAIFANKFPGVYATTCLTVDEARNTRSINNCNVLAVSGMSTPPDKASEILDTFLNTPFKAPCAASGNNPWPSDIDTFFTHSLSEMPSIGNPVQTGQSDRCSLCELMKTREETEPEYFTPVEIMPGGRMKIIRETPTSAIVRFKAGSVEPAHHHTFGHDLVVLKGRKSVWNLSKKERFDLVNGDYLFTPAGDVYRVKYYEDTEFFIKWDGPWDIFLDEDLDAARAALQKEN